MKITKDNFESAFVNELERRGYKDCEAFNNPWMPSGISYTDGFDCKYSVMYYDDQKDIVIIVNNICEGDESEMIRQMVVCNNFNSESRYARFCCNDSGGIIVKAEVSCATGNIIQVCADVFETVCSEVAGLVEYLFGE